MYVSHNNSYGVINSVAIGTVSHDDFVQYSVMRGIDQHTDTIGQWIGTDGQYW